VLPINGIMNHKPQTSSDASWNWYTLGGESWRVIPVLACEMYRSMHDEWNRTVRISLSIISGSIQICMPIQLVEVQLIDPCYYMTTVQSTRQKDNIVQ
jgi:hypothetical protein